MKHKQLHASRQEKSKLEVDVCDVAPFASSQLSSFTNLSHPHKMHKIVQDSDKHLNIVENPIETTTGFV